MSLPSENGAAGAGTLYVVATPIGNLGDVTLRALEVLRSVPLVAAEDTRLTRRLWARHEVTTRLASYHARSPRGRTSTFLGHLRSGADLALVSDAGTPLVSDPGGDLVSSWAAEGGRVVPIPGASAVLAALVASGIRAPRWSFEGFLPRRGRERRERLARIAADDRVTVLFEASQRCAATLRELAEVSGDGRPAALCRELTKRHEETWRGTVGALAARAEDAPPRGEVTIVVAGRATSEAVGPESACAPSTSAAEGGAHAVAQARTAVDELVAGGLPRSAAARRVARETGLPRRTLFDRGDGEESS